jgi:hypothetical protein
LAVRRQARFGAVLAIGLSLAGCATQPAPLLPDPSQVARHELAHGPPWGPEEIPWVTPPEVLAYGPGYWGPGYWGPGYWGPSVGIGLGFGMWGGRGWRGHPGWGGRFHHHRGIPYGRGHFHGRGGR